MRLHIHWHRLVKRVSAITYHECRCGHRYAHWHGHWFTPVDEGWVRTGQWTPPLLSLGPDDVGGLPSVERKA